MTINIFTTRTPEGNYLPNKGELMELIQKTMFPGEEEFSFLQNAPTEDILNLDDISAAVSDAVERLGPKALMIWAELLNQRSYLVAIIKDIQKDLKHESPHEILIEWIVQRMLFFEIGDALELESVLEFSENQDDCAIALTAKGSIIIIGNSEKGTRRIDYLQIDSLKAKWDSRTSAIASITTPIQVGERAHVEHLFDASSPIQYVLVLPKNRPRDLDAVIKQIIERVEIGNGEVSPENPSCHPPDKIGTEWDPNCE